MRLLPMENPGKTLFWAAIVCLFTANPVQAEEPLQGEELVPVEETIEAPELAEIEEGAQTEELVIADFDTGDKPTNLGGDFGSWDKDPNDDTQGADMSFVSDDALGNAEGYSLRIDYDVDSPNPAYNGFWMKLNGLDATGHHTINFYLKGEVEAGFTKRLKVELKDMSNTASPYVVTGITDQWQKISVPLEKFRQVTDWSGLNELVLVFDDINSSPKTGAILLDQVTLSHE